MDGWEKGTEAERILIEFVGGDLSLRDLTKQTIASVKPSFQGGPRLFSVQILRQCRIIRQERFARNVAAEKGAKTQEYLAYFKFLQRMYDTTFPPSAVGTMVRCCLKFPRISILLHPVSYSFKHICEKTSVSWAFSTD